MFEYMELALIWLQEYPGLTPDVAPPAGAAAAALRATLQNHAKTGLGLALALDGRFVDQLKALFRRWHS